MRKEEKMKEDWEKVKKSLCHILKFAYPYILQPDDGVNL